MKAAPEGLLKPGDAAVLGIERKVQFQYLAFETEYRNVLRPAERLRIVMAGACRPGGRACQNPGICPQLSRRLPSSHYFFPHLQSIDLCDRMPGPHQPPPASGGALPRISISARRQHRLFGANVCLAALLGYGSELSMFGATCPCRASLPAYRQRTRTSICPAHVDQSLAMRANWHVICTTRSRACGYRQH